MDKRSIRKLYSEKRLALSAAEYSNLNSRLLDQFKKIDLSVIKYLHIFLPLLSRNEPDTLPAINWLKANYSEITIVYPKCNFADYSMESYADDADLVLAESKFGIMEPIRGNTVEAEKIDMIILPLLAFDILGYRVGYGKGFYDRFIARCRADVQMIGLSFFVPLDEAIDVDRHDKKMQQCITPESVCVFIAP